ncbi:MAG: diguanylate cyclase [Gallionella sp.]|nr:diguanylate cyclase [Gallionella sp.]MDP1940792.1 diguanylate cyclase [Gallionella sp.]
MSVSPEITRDLLARAVDQSHDGITIADARMKDFPLIYVNAGFERLSGYPADDLLGKSCRFLQGVDTDQPDIAVLREALHQGKNCVVTLRNYRKDGALFWNELSISALRNEQGELTHFVGIQKDVTGRILSEQHLRQSHLDLLNRQRDTQLHTDPLVGLSNRQHFDEQLAHMLQTAQRTHSLLSVLVIDLDQFGRFNARYGRPAGDTCLRMVGERIAKSFSRASDCVARYENDEFAVVSSGDSLEGMQQHASKLRDQIRALNIPHHDSPDGVVTICIGCTSLIPQRDTDATSLLKLADNALQQAKQHGYDYEHIN